MVNKNKLPVAIIGAGPVGLATAAQLRVRNQSFILFEAGDFVASNIVTWEHVRLFSPWRYNIDKAARQLLNETDWQSPSDDELPTGKELVDHYLKPLSELATIKPHIVLNAKVISVGRKNMDKTKSHGRDVVPFVVQVQRKSGIEQHEVKAVIDASGTWSAPNPIGSGGTYAVGEMEQRDKIFYGIPDILERLSSRYGNKNVLVVGGGHSAIQVILELAKLKGKFPNTEIHWVFRKKRVADVYGRQENDALQARGMLGSKVAALVNNGTVNVYSPFLIQEIINDQNTLTIVGAQEDRQYALPGIDEIISNTGSRPDFSFLKEVRLHTDPSIESAAEIAPLIDPNIHSCGTVRPHGEKDLRHHDKNFYIVGSKSYGRAPTFLLATGYEQVRSIVAALDGDFESARSVELDLPETGVCSVEAAGSPCCGTPVPNEVVGTGCC